MSIKTLPRRRRTGRLGNSTESRSRAEDLSRKFHGREIVDVNEIFENYKEPVNLADLGILEELVANPIHSKYEYVFNFEEQNEANEVDVIKVCSHPNGKQLYFVGGNQDVSDIIFEMAEDRDSQFDKQNKFFDKDNLDIEHRHYILVGWCTAITYFTDKHHLAGPSYQAKGTSYEHEFGEDGGYPPLLAYDGINKRLMLIGGTYHVEDRGICD